MKIRARLTIVMLLISILPLFGFAVFAITRVTDRVRKDHIQLLENTAFNNADKIDRFLQQRYWEIHSWVTLDIPKVALEFETHERLNQLLNHLVQTYSGYSCLMVYDNDGRLFAVNNFDSSGKEVDVGHLWSLDVRDEEWYNRNLQGQMVVGEPELQKDESTKNKSNIVRVSAPISGEDGNIMGVWVSILNWDAIHRILSLAQSELHQSGLRSALVFLLSKDCNTVIDFPDPDVIGKASADYKLTGISTTSFSNPTGYLQSEWDGSHKSVGFSRIRDELSWSCAVSIDNSEIFAPVTRLNYAFIYLVSGIFAIMLPTVSYLSRRISQPIISISRSTKAIAKGDFEHIEMSNSKDEIGELAASFSDMARSLKEYQSRLQDYNRMLETTVEDRTGELRSSEEKFRSLFEQAPVGIVIQLDDGRIISANRAFCKMLGYDRQELEKLNILDLCLEQEYDRLRTNSDAEEIEFYMRRKDGNVFPAIVSNRSLEYEGKNAFETIIQDLSPRKELEDQIRSERDFNKKIIDTIDLFVLGMDLRDSSIILFNQGAENISGYQRDEVLGRNYKELFVPQRVRDEIDGLSKAVRNNLEEEFSLKGKEIPIITKSGEERVLSWTTALIRDSSGTPTGTIAFGLDITEKKRIEEQLVQSERLRALGEMASGVAHDFNNVLATIVGNAQLTMLATEDQDVVGCLHTIEQAAKDGAETVKRIQEFSRVRRDTAQLGVDMNRVIQDVAAITRPRWRDQTQSSDITIDLRIDLKAQESIIAGNAAELREVLTNLIFNAVDAMPEGGEIVIKTYNETGYIITTIADTGIGMPDTVMRRIFEPFFSTKDIGNSGLGLSVSYGIIGRYNGQISVSSKPNQGTTFTIKLPLDPEAKLEREKPEATKKAEKAKILVIDDEEEIRQLISTILSNNGNEIQVAVNGEEGLRLLKQDSFDVIITDLGMPRMSGYEVAKKAKLLDAKVPVIMVTGWGTQLDEKKLKQSGVDLVISKPFDIRALINRISEAMEIRKLM